MVHGATLAYSLESVQILFNCTKPLTVSAEEKIIEVPGIFLFLYNLLVSLCFLSLLQEDILSAKPLTCLLHSVWGLFICCIAALSESASLNLWQAGLLTRRGEILQHEGLLQKIRPLNSAVEEFRQMESLWPHAVGNCFGGENVLDAYRIVMFDKVKKMFAKVHLLFTAPTEFLPEREAVELSM